MMSGLEEKDNVEADGSKTLVNCSRGKTSMFPVLTPHHRASCRAETKTTTAALETVREVEPVLHLDTTIANRPRRSLLLTANCQ